MGQTDHAPKMKRKRDLDFSAVEKHHSERSLIWKTFGGFGGIVKYGLDKEWEETIKVFCDCVFPSERHPLVVVCVLEYVGALSQERVALHRLHKMLALNSGPLFFCSPVFPKRKRHCDDLIFSEDWKGLNDMDCCGNVHSRCGVKLCNIYSDDNKDNLDQIVAHQDSCIVCLMLE
jgi:hypothetical protein